MRETRLNGGGNGAERAGQREGVPPVDLGHLSRQTFGDEALGREILAMFLDQLDDGGRMAAAGPEERRRIAHALVGSARGVGAFALADCAAAIERAPASEEAMRRYGPLADAVRVFVRGLNGETAAAYS